MGNQDRHFQIDGVAGLITGEDLFIRLCYLEDCEDVFHWRNDPVTRTMSVSTDEIPWDKHRVWYNGVLVSEKVLMLMGGTLDSDGEIADDKVGVTRYNFSVDHPANVDGVKKDDKVIVRAEFSINMNPAMRGKGYANELMWLSEEYLAWYFGKLKDDSDSVEIFEANERRKKFCSMFGDNIVGIDVYAYVKTDNAVSNRIFVKGDYHIEHEGKAEDGYSNLNTYHKFIPLT